MSRKPENVFRESVHRHLPKDIHHEKMANPYSSGTADDWYSGNKADLWIEYKFLPRVPQRSVVSPLKLLSPLQALWLKSRHEEGRSVAVVIGCPDGGIILTNLAWTQDIPAEQFRKMLIDRKDVSMWIAKQTKR